MTTLACNPARRRPAAPGRGSAGFTLIELMVVVVVIGILAAIAYPAYTNSVIKGKRAQGRTALLELMQQQERYFTQNNTYYLIATAGATGTPFKTYAGDSPASPPYLLKAELCTAGTARDCVLLTAVQQFTDPVAGSLTLLSTGAKSCTGTDNTVCWK